MFIKTTQQANGKINVRIVESLREDKQVKQKTIRNLGSYEEAFEVKKACEFGEQLIIELKNLKDPVLPGLESRFHGRNKKSGESKKEDFLDKPISISRLKLITEERRVEQGFDVLFGELFSKLKFDQIISGTDKDSQWNELLRKMVIGRISDPSSKRRTCKTLSSNTGEAIPLELVYRMMDRLFPRIETLKEAVLKNTLSLFNNQIDVLFFDVTTLYFESFESDDLKQCGYSKDAKFKEVQVVLALITNSYGHPVSYELFSGKTSETTTLMEVIKKLKEKFEVKNVLLVADRAMFNEKNLSYMEENNINYIVAAKLKALSRDLKSKVLSDCYKLNPVDDEVHWIQEIPLPTNDRRLIVSYNSKRALHDKKMRTKLLDRLLKKTKEGKIPASELISNHGSKKFIKVIQSKIILDQNKISNDELWDGLHGVITNISANEISAPKILSKYRGLWRIEEAFRINKTDLKMRPIFHWKAPRVRAHIAICFLAYALSKHMLLILERSDISISFQDLKDMLSKDQFSIYEDQKTKTRFQIPSKIPDTLLKIYSALGLTRNNSAVLL